MKNITILTIASALLLGLFILNKLPQNSRENKASKSIVYPAQSERCSIIRTFEVDGSDSTLSHIDLFEREYCSIIERTEHKTVYLDDSQECDSIFVYNF